MGTFAEDQASQQDQHEFQFARQDVASVAADELGQLFQHVKPRTILLILETYCRWRRREDCNQDFVLHLLQLAKDLPEQIYQRAMQAMGPYGGLTLRQWEGLMLSEEFQLPQRCKFIFDIAFHEDGVGHRQHHFLQAMQEAEESMIKAEALGECFGEDEVQGEKVVLQECPFSAGVGQELERIVTVQDGGVEVVVRSSNQDGGHMGVDVGSRRCGHPEVQACQKDNRVLLGADVDMPDEVATKTFPTEECRHSLYGGFQHERRGGELLSQQIADRRTHQGLPLYSRRLGREQITSDKREMVNLSYLQRSEQKHEQILDTYQNDDNLGGYLPQTNKSRSQEQNCCTLVKDQEHTSNDQFIKFGGQIPSTSMHAHYTLHHVQDEIRYKTNCENTQSAHQQQQRADTRQLLAESQQLPWFKDPHVLDTTKMQEDKCVVLSLHNGVPQSSAAYADLQIQERNAIPPTPAECQAFCFQVPCSAKTCPSGEGVILAAVGSQAAKQDHTVATSLHDAMLQPDASGSHRFEAAAEDLELKTKCAQGTEGVAGSSWSTLDAHPQQGALGTQQQRLGWQDIPTGWTHSIEGQPQAQESGALQYSRAQGQPQNQSSWVHLHSSYECNPWQCSVGMPLPQRTEGCSLQSQQALQHMPPGDHNDQDEPSRPLHHNLPACTQPTHLDARSPLCLQAAFEPCESIGTSPCCQARLVSQAAVKSAQEDKEGLAQRHLTRGTESQYSLQQAASVKRCSTDRCGLLDREVDSQPVELNQMLYYLPATLEDQRQSLGARCQQLSCTSPNRSALCKNSHVLGYTGVSLPGSNPSTPSKKRRAQDDNESWPDQENTPRKAAKLSSQDQAPAHRQQLPPGEEVLDYLPHYQVGHIPSHERDIEVVPIVQTQVACPPPQPVIPHHSTSHSQGGKSGSQVTASTGSQRHHAHSHKKYKAQSVRKHRALPAFQSLSSKSSLSNSGSFTSASNSQRHAERGRHLKWERVNQAYSIRHSKGPARTVDSDARVRPVVSACDEVTQVEGQAAAQKQQEGQSTDGLKGLQGRDRSIGVGVQVEPRVDRLKAVPEAETADNSPLQPGPVSRLLQGAQHRIGNNKVQPQQEHLTSHTCCATSEDNVPSYQPSQSAKHNFQAMTRTQLQDQHCSAKLIVQRGAKQAQSSSVKEPASMGMGLETISAQAKPSVSGYGHGESNAHEHLATQRLKWSHQPATGQIHKRTVHSEVAQHNAMQKLAGPHFSLPQQTGTQSSSALLLSHSKKLPPTVPPLQLNAATLAAGPSVELSQATQAGFLHPPSGHLSFPACQDASPDEALRHGALGGGGLGLEVTGGVQQQYFTPPNDGEGGCVEAAPPQTPVKARRATRMVFTPNSELLETKQNTAQMARHSQIERDLISPIRRQLAEQALQSNVSQRFRAIQQSASPASQGINADSDDDASLPIKKLHDFF